MSFESEYNRMLNRIAKYMATMPEILACRKVRPVVGAPLPPRPPPPGLALGLLWVACNAAGRAKRGWTAQPVWLHDGLD